MAKPKTPLLSLGARGSIGDTLTFQKRGRITIARRKPIPTDLKTDLQLAQRQAYREAVAAWNALTPEEKEAYRGVYPGLTPYQCFMKITLLTPPVPPPPEEFTEEQLLYNNILHISGGGKTRAGQRLTIPNRQVNKLGFWLHKTLNPTGPITFDIRKASDDSLISSKGIGDAADLTGAPIYYEAEFADPQTIDEEVRILCAFSGGDSANRIEISLQTTDVKANEYFFSYTPPTYTDYETMDCAYRYKYYEV